MTGIRTELALRSRALRHSVDRPTADRRSHSREISPAAATIGVPPASIALKYAKRVTARPIRRRVSAGRPALPTSDQRSPPRSARSVKLHHGTAASGECPRPALLRGADRLAHPRPGNLSARDLTNDMARDRVQVVRGRVRARLATSEWTRAKSNLVAGPAAMLIVRVIQSAAAVTPRCPGRPPRGGASRRALPPRASCALDKGCSINGQDQGDEPGGRARRRRDDPHHLEIHQRQADPSLSRHPVEYYDLGIETPRQDRRSGHDRSSRGDQETWASVSNAPPSRRTKPA